MTKSELLQIFSAKSAHFSKYVDSAAIPELYGLLDEAVNMAYDAGTEIKLSSILKAVIKELE